MERRHQGVSRRSLLAAAAAAALVGHRAVAEPMASDEAAIQALLRRMSLEEKLGQLCQARGELNDTGPYVPPGSEADVRAGRVGSFLGVHGADETRRLQRIAVEESRLGVPLLFAFDVVHGFRTIFPTPLAEAATFDPEAAELSARIAAREAAAHGLHWTFAPMVDIARDPRWGRIVEGAGEDPCLGSAMARARVRGFQGGDLAAVDTLAATAKHFVAYGAAEGGRDYNVAEVSQRTLFEVYLPPFEAAVRAGVASVMAGFNEVAGVPMHANRPLIDGILRRTWGFEGVVVSDYTGVRELIAHGVAEGPEAAGVLALRAGVDVDMVSAIYARDLPGAVLGGRLDLAVVDQAVLRVLRLKQRLGLFDDPYRYCDPERQQAVTLAPEHRKAARRIAGRSMVLLKNDGDLLPLAKDARTIAVIGPLADDRRSMLGSWIGAGRAEDAVSPLEGLRRAAGRKTQVLHAMGVAAEGDDPGGLEAAERLARQADLVILCVGEPGDMDGEARSRVSLDLPGRQEELVRRVQAVGKPVVAVVFAGRPLTIGWMAEHVPAILLAWHPGVEGGNAIADVLFGKADPAGRLPVSFPRSVGQVPIYYDHKPTGRPASAAETNTSKYIDAPWTPLFAFGHGLGYASFAYEAIRLSTAVIRRDQGVQVEVDLANISQRDGEEVTQLYLHDETASTTRPVLELRRFERVRLKAGERRTLRFELGPADLAVRGADMRPAVEPGAFAISAGGSSASLISARLIVEG